MIIESTNSKMLVNIKHICLVFCSALLFISFSSIGYAQERLKIRSGDHPTYSRIVFDWTKNVNYTAQIIDDRLKIEFDAIAEPDFSSVLLDGPIFLSNPTSDTLDNKLNIYFQINTEGSVRHFRSGTKIVVDMVVNDGANNNVTPRVEPPEPAAITIPLPVAEPTPTPVVTEANIDEPELSPVNDGTVLVQARSTSDAFVFNYVWGEDVKAAAFIRGNTLWVVFDKFAVVNHEGINSVLGRQVLTAEQLMNLSPTILNYSIAPGQNARMVKTSRGWELSLRNTISVPQSPIEISRQSINNLGENIFLSATDLGNVINVEDPNIGDTITIVTASGSSQGVLEQYNFTEFNILKSSQGIAFQLIADDIFVTRHVTGVSISAQNGLAVSKSKFPILRDVIPVVMDDVENTLPQMLIDFAKWEVGPLPDQPFTKNRHELLYQLSSVTDDDRNEARWNLAIYDLANNNAAEAIGILQLMAESEPGFIENPSFRAVLAVSNIKLNRYDDAIELLTHKSLAVELDTLLWRSLAYEATGEYQKARDDFSIGVDVLSLQNNDNKADFLFSSIRAAQALGDVEYLNSQINGMKNIQLNAIQLVELDYWRAKMAEGYGDEVLAGEEYDRVIAAGVRQPKAHATFDRINQQYRLGEIDVAQAIDALEKLRFSWRGDDFELELLNQLGDLYVDQQDYREGLATLRQAATYFPRTNKTIILTKKMTDIYYNLFLGGGTENMPPLKSMALFLEFRELTPLGADGDEMLRNLANRMVEVDLLNDAANLLEHQVKNRLKGVARADIASNLAMVYLMNKEPEKSLQILRSTRQEQIPDDIELERRMIEIRTLVELDRFEEAEVMVEGVTGEVAENIRSDIYWKTENWDSVVNHDSQVLGDRWADSQELTVVERQIVLRIAVAMALGEDIGGLERIRTQYMDHMAGGMFADAFEVITAKEQKTGADIRKLTQTIASVDRLESFMDSYRDEFSVTSNVN